MSPARSAPPEAGPAVGACPCGGERHAVVHTYDAPPEGETRFSFTDRAGYRRKLTRCPTCGHFLSIERLTGEDLYCGEYVDSTYGRDGIRAAFDQCLKCRTPVITTAAPRSSQAAMTSSSLFDPPGWTSAVMPASSSWAGPSRNGKNASDAATASDRRSAWPLSRAERTAIPQLNTRDI